MMTDFKYECKDLEAMSSACNYHIWILSKFKKFLGNNVAEVGAGSGNFSKLLLHEPIKQLVIIEPSKEAILILQSKMTSDARIISHNNFFSEISEQYKNYFDSVVYIDVLEHVKNDEMELKKVYDSLKKDSYVCIFVPALSWLYSDHDKSIGHFRRYHKKQLSELLKKSGFEIVKLEYFDIFGIIPWFVMFKILKKKINPDNVGFYDKFIVPISQTIETFITPPIGKNLIIVGKKISG